jgi:hypothetical protein
VIASTQAPRSLHLDQAIECIDFDSPSPPITQTRSHVVSLWTAVTLLAECPAFVIEQVRMVEGLEQHIKDLDAMFVYAPDTKISVHPIRFGRAGYTCVTGIMTGTFTEPMPTGEGQFIQPTGKAFSVPMCTVGHWENGVMVEEWLFWDNATYLKQIGIGG